ncbi:MAG TPA: hypothetical protein VGG74_31525 [Kofleriaceae bacterium]
MAISCEACGLPVHENVVKCPHCGSFTGTPADPIAVAEAEGAMATAQEPIDDRLPLEARFATAIADAVTHAIDVASELVKSEQADDRLPRARARPKR